MANQHWDPAQQRWVDDGDTGGGVATVVEAPPVVVEQPAVAPRDVVNNPPQGWRIRPIPNLANLTIEWECSSVDGDVFKTHVQDDIAGLIQGIEDAKRTQPPAQGQISAGDVQAFGSQFGLR